MKRLIPVITIDGPSGSGKGTVGRLLAEQLKWHFLDSGALYRVLAFAALEAGTDLNDEESLTALAKQLRLRFSDKVYLNDQDVTGEIRKEAVSEAASQVAAYSRVRKALIKWQRDFCKPPGLVADGRDMGTVIFPDAKLKIYLDASQKERARRRHKQLQQGGINVSLSAVFQDLAERDQRDSQRQASPLKPAPGAKVIDTTKLGIDEVVAEILNLYEKLFNPRDV